MNRSVFDQTKHRILVYKFTPVSNLIKDKAESVQFIQH